MLEHEGAMVCSVLIDRDGWRMATLESDVATTLVAVASEDPADWNEVCQYWPRYTSRVVPEFASQLEFEGVSREQTIESICKTDSWIVLDFVQKRFLSGHAFQEITRDACFAMHTDENGDQCDPVSVHFAPWWELYEHVDAEVIDHPRQTELRIPFVDREFLFGEALIQDLASRVLNLAMTERGRAALDSEDRHATHPLTIEVHRDWLMTPRDDLGGKFPRQMLHGGMKWIDSLVWGVQLRFMQGGGRIVAAPKSTVGYQHGPFGREELAIYFDLCRELINSGWFWCREQFELGEGTPTDDDSRDSYSADSKRQLAETKDLTSMTEQLASFFRDVKENWLQSSFEGGSPPAFIVECSRRRVPRGAGVEIIGMSDRESEEHVIDCDCPICNMMADGALGVGFIGIDGHHLDLDDEFAFSMHETREAWDAQQREYAEFSAKCDRDREERERKIAAGEIEEADEFSSAWKGSIGFGSNVRLPGDRSGNMQLAFMLAEIISELEQTNDGGDNEAELIRQLNADFTNFRNSDLDDLATVTKQFASTLELAATHHSPLVPRIADFQSRLADRLRNRVSDNDFDEGMDDVPF